MLILLIKASSYLPFRALYVLADFIAFVLRLTYRKKVVMSNLKSAFPKKSEKELKEISRQTYQNMADVMVESVKSFRLTREELGQRLVFINASILEAYKEKRQSVYILAAHQCNWEWLALGFSSLLPIPADILYKPLKDKAFDDHMLSIRSRFGGYPIPKDSALMEIMRRRDKTRAICIAADQVPMRSTNKFWVRFMNQDTAFYMGPEQLPKFTNLPVFFARIWRTSRGYYKVELVPVAKPPYAKGQIDILPKYVEEAEHMIRQSPGDWLWSHRRWKYPKPSESDKVNQFEEESN